MSDAGQLAERFIAALAANDPAAYAEILGEDVGMRVARWDGGEAFRPRANVVQRLVSEWSAWPDATVQSLSVIAEGERAAVQFRIQATENLRYMEHNRSAFLTVRDDKIQTIDLYCPEPCPSARRQGWIAPATMTEDELSRLFESFQYAFDLWEWLPPGAIGRISARISWGGSGDPHPGSNWVMGARWSAEEADARIGEKLDYFRSRNLGLVWHVGPYDTPPDLGERLERRGFVIAGYEAMMARAGLHDLDIRVNPNVEIEILDGSNDQSIEDLVQVGTVCFHWTAEQAEERRQSWLERLKTERFRKEDLMYLARLNGVPVANAQLIFRAGTAYLGGAGTLPEYRGQKIYSTLLRRRLEDAHARGYHIACIHAGPMSRRVVERYGFKEYARICLYAWMPVMDEQVIRSLVPDE